MIQSGLPGFDAVPGRTDDAETLAALEVDYTPPAVAVQLLLALALVLQEMGVVWEPRHGLDPAAGSGCWLRAMRAVWPDMHLTGIEARESEGANLLAAADTAIIGDGVDAADGRLFDLVATNPPFSAFSEGWPLQFRRRHLLTSGGVVAFYGLSQWGQAADHQAMLREWSPALQLRVGGRIAHRGDGAGDAREYSLWAWTCARSTDPAARRLENLGRPSWRTVQLPELPTAFRRWSPTSVPGTYPIDPALVAEIRARYL